MSDLPNDDTSDDIRDYRAAKDEASEARREADKVRRELAFLKAGIDTEAGAGKWFAKGYDGELTVEAIKAAAEADGITGGAPAEPEPQVQLTDDERQMARERAAIATQAEPPGSEPSKDPHIDMLETFRASAAAGDTRDKAAAKAYGKLFSAAMAGDKRAVHDPREWAERARAESGG